jgi:general secretion pathway protein K
VKHRLSVPAHERGAALLAVLLLVAIMGAIAAGAFEKLRLSTALASNASSLDQARAYALGIEDLLALRVDDLVAESPEMTTLKGDWNGAMRRIDLPGAGEAEGTIRDGSNCFNLNSLADGADPAALIARPAGITQFLGLMGALGVSGPQARRIADSAADWVDSDHEPAGSGAEDSLYAALDPQYRPANTLFAEVSELRAVAGMDEEVYARLRPFLCALPSTEMSPLNVNTLLPNQAPLVTMLVPGAIGLDAARAVIGARPASGWKNQNDFWAARGLAGLTPPADAQNQVQLRTSFFSLDVRIALNGAELRETALIDARLAPARVAVRRWGTDE